MEQVDSLINALKRAEYTYSGYGDNGRKSTSKVISGCWPEETTVARQAILEWIQDNHNGLQVENESLKQRVEFLEEMVSKSNFAPFVGGSTRKPFSKKEAR